MATLGPVEVGKPTRVELKCVAGAGQVTALRVGAVVVHPEQFTVDETGHIHLEAPMPADQLLQLGVRLPVKYQFHDQWIDSGARIWYVVRGYPELVGQHQILRTRVRWSMGVDLPQLEDGDHLFGVARRIADELAWCSGSQEDPAFEEAVAQMGRHLRRYLPEYLQRGSNDPAH